MQLAYISPQPTCHGDLSETPASIRGPKLCTAIRQIPIARALEAPTGLNCPDQPHHGPPPIHMGLRAARPGRSCVRVTLVPVLLLAATAPALGFPRLTSHLTCHITFCWILDCWTACATCHHPCSARPGWRLPPDSPPSCPAPKSMLE